MPAHLSDGEGMRPEIAMSWRRSTMCGVQPDVPIPLDSGSEHDTRLLRSAMPVLEELADQIAGTGLCVLLADRDCRIVRRVFDDTRVERRLETLGILSGALCAEDMAGTNAIGTPFELRQGVVINGTEHYLEQLRALSCYGHPIIHPATRRIEGILDMTIEASEVNPLFVPFVTRAARDIERRLLDGSRVSQQQLVQAFQSVRPQPHLAVAAIGVDMLLTNEVAMNTLDATDHVLLHEIAAELRPGEIREVQLELSSGNTVAVQVNAVPGTDGGAVFLMRSARASSNRIRRGVNAAPGSANRLKMDLARMRTIPGALAVCGEPGTGRTTAAQLLVEPDQAHWLDGVRAVVDGQPRWLRELIAAANSDASAVVVENVQLLPEAILTVLGRLIDSGTQPRIVLTGAPMAQLPPQVAALVTRCAGRVELPPLRQRRLDMPEISRALLAELGGHWRLTPRAFTALSAADWPGNFSELRLVLRSAAETAQTPDIIDVSDLPPGYQSVTRVAHLAGRERAEREAIIGALSRAGGNKVHASTELGISRSTLYARMKALGIGT